MSGGPTNQPVDMMGINSRFAKLINTENCEKSVCKPTPKSSISSAQVPEAVPSSYAPGPTSLSCSSFFSLSESSPRLTKSACLSVATCLMPASCQESSLELPSSEASEARTVLTDNTFQYKWQKNNYKKAWCSELYNGHYINHNYGQLHRINIHMISIILILFWATLGTIHSKNSVSAKCSYPGSPAHASVAFTNDKMTPGTVATYTCDNGYELLGPSRRVCHQNGTWTPLGIPFCVLNVAVGKAAMQSSTVGQGHAQKAVDGSPSSFFNPATCTMTEAEPSPWFYVNLLEPVLVQLVRIDFGASCCQGRPATITVRVGNNRPDLGTNPLCRKFTGFIEEGRPLYLPCTRPMAGAFVSIQLESNGNGSPLSICELFVYTDHALSIEQCPTFRDQPLGGTSTYDGKCYIFYNEHPLNFENAKKFCEVRGGTLVDETSPALQGFLSWELYRRHRNDPNGQYWLGAVRDNRNAQNWRWINGKDVSISFWNLPMSRENCSRFDGTKGWLWTDTNCNLKLNYVCQHRPLSCGRPERPPNSTVLIRSVDVGQTIEYHCNDGHLLIGPNIRTCMPNGFFSEYAPKCKYIECGPPQSISNGIYVLNNKSRAYMSTLTYQCNDGYVLVGRGNLVCDVDGLWNGPPPRCEPVLCPNPPLILNGFSTLVSNSTRFDSIVEYACDAGFELVGEKLIQCNRAGYWEGQPGYCVELAPSTQTTSTSTSLSVSSSHSSTTSVAPTLTVSSNAPTTAYPTTFFDTNPVRGYGGFSDSKSNSGKSPQIALLPINNGQPNPANQAPVQSNVYTNPYNTKSPQEQWPVTTVSSLSNPTTISSSSIASTGSTATGSTSSSVSTTNRIKQSNHHQQTSIHLRPPTSQRPSVSITNVRMQENEIPDSGISSNTKGFLGKPSKIAAARLNMGGIIALAIFGGFVFLAAIITIIVIIVRRIKHSHSSLDAQTISTFDSSNGDNAGFYHKYASAWSQLQSSAVLHSGSYKPSRLGGAGGDIPYEHHHYLHARTQRSSPNGGSINEAFRDAGPDSDVYTRSADRRNNNLNGSGSSGNGAKRSSDHDRDWQHVTRAKY